MCIDGLSISLLAKMMATARDRSSAMMQRFLEGGDVLLACNFNSNDDDKDDDNILHYDLFGVNQTVV